MKRFIICFLMSSLFFSIYAQEEDLTRIIREGIKLHDRGYYEAAINCYQEGLMIYPESLAAYYYMAQSYACIEKYKDSRKCAEKAFMYEMNNEPTDKVSFYLEALSMYVTLVFAARSLEDETVLANE